MTQEFYIILYTNILWYIYKGNEKMFSDTQGLRKNVIHIPLRNTQKIYLS